MIVKPIMAAAALLLATGCAPRYPTCAGDSHCRAGERCLRQRCQAPELPPAPRAPSGPSVRAVMEKACTGGNARSCLLLGRQHHQAGQRDRARPYLDRACQAGNTEACALAGRAVPYTAFVRHGVPGVLPAGGLRLSAFKAVTLVKLTGPGSQRLMVTLKEALETACGCVVGYSEDLDMMDGGELMLAGVVLSHRAVSASGAKTPVKQPPGKGGPESPVPGMKVTPQKKVILPTGRCRRAAVAAKLWLIHRGNHKAPTAVLVRGASGAGACVHTMERAMDRLAGQLVELLKGKRRWKVRLFRDPAMPALGKGNKHLEAARFAEALAAYDEAVAAATQQKLPAAAMANAHYSRGVALAGLGRHTEAMTALDKASATSADALYLPLKVQLRVVTSEAWRTPPPRYRKLKKKKKRRKPPWGPRLQRRVVWE